MDVNQAAFAAQLGATDACNAAFDEAWDLAHFCAVLLEGRMETLALLGLHKRRDESTGGIKGGTGRLRLPGRPVEWGGRRGGGPRPRACKHPSPAPIAFSVFPARTEGM